MITKNSKEIEILKEGGKRLAQVLAIVAAKAQPGVLATDLDKLAEEEIVKRDGKSAFKNYRSNPSDTPFPATLCVSINSEVVHGVPRKGKILKEGDIVGLDLGMWFQGLCTDTATTVGVGQVNKQSLDLMGVTKVCLTKALQAVKAGATIGDIGFAIQSFAEENGFSPVRELVGHGVGKSIHEPPDIPCFGISGKGAKLKEGLVIAIEPMINQGHWKVVFDSQDGWTVRTADGSLSAHEEHTVLVTKDGCEVITMNS